MPSPPVPAGIFALPLHYAALTLAASATFQGLVGAADANGALPKIFRGETDEHEGADGPPRALLDIDGENDFEKVSTTGFFGTGRIQMVLEIPTPPAYQGAGQRRDARIWAYDWVGAVIAEMQALAGMPGYLNIIRFSESNTGRADPKENDGADFWVSIWRLEWQG